jgi:orotidine-5'-phosphate decarboxylase
MIRAAVEAAGEAASAAGGGAGDRAGDRAGADAGGGVWTGPSIAAVTVLTSLSGADLTAVGLAGPALAAVLRLAELAVAAGATALVCSPSEVSEVRRAVGTSVTLITPGVRPRGSAWADQSRVATPGEAVAAGADLVVVGRPITGAADPGVAAAAVAAELVRPR